MRPVKPTTAFTGFEQASWGQLELREILGTYEYLHDHFGPLPDTVRLRGLWALALNAGWVVPHENVCWLSERCTDLAVDAQGRLHSGFGPALSFADGWKYYSWKGVAIPDWVVEKRAALTVQAIDRVLDPIVRRCMIEIMTPERYVTEGGARCIATDTVGKLWQSRWGLDIWNVVEVVNGTPEPDGTTRRYYLQVPPEVGTPIEAVAWTYGLNTERYATLKLRT